MFAQPNKSNEHAVHWRSFDADNCAQTFACISDAFDYLERQKRFPNEELHVLITGSLHLVGETIRTIQLEV